MNKKIITALLAAAMAASAMTACGEVEEDGVSSSPDMTIEIITEESSEQQTEAAEEEKTTSAEDVTEADTGEAQETTTVSGQEEVQEQTGAEVPTEALTQTPTEAPTQAPTEVPTQAPTEAPTEPPAAFEHDDMTFVYGNSYATVLAEASGLVSALGTPLSVEEAPSCLSNGKDIRTYYYNGITIYTYIDGNMDIIYEIELTDASYSTAKGLKVGMTLADAERIYGKNYIYSGGVVSYYDTDTTYLYLYMSGDTIASIGYAAEV